ncbi:DUF748 domain-containing protein [Sulfurimonas sp.]|uniref:DUF748 domain-containing protein n=1 Tax=Sulfurimonas sp. TaxID=2022749 RepID=UPI003569B474
MNKSKIALWTLGSLVVIYTLSGFFLAPYFAKKIATEELKKQYSIDLNIKKIYFNPYTFYIEIEDLNIYEKNTPLISFSQLSANFNPTKYLLNTLEISEASLSGLKVHPVLEKNEDLNFLRIFTKKTKSKTQNKESAPLIFKLDSFTLSDSFLHFKDLTQEKVFDLNVGPLNHTFTGLTTKPMEKSDHSLAFDLNEYGKLLINGKVTINPLIVQVKIDHSAIKLSNTDYIFKDQNFAFNNGVFEYMMDFILESNGKTIIKIPSFKAGVKDLELLVDENKTFESKNINLELLNLNFITDTKELEVEKINTFLHQNKIYDNFIAQESHLVDDLNISINKLDLNNTFDANVNAIIENTQKLKIDSKINLAQKDFEFDIGINSFDLSNYNKYLSKYANISMKYGFINLSSKLKIKPEDIVVENLIIDKMKLYIIMDNTQKDSQKQNIKKENGIAKTNNEKTQMNFELKEMSLNNSSISIKDKADLELKNINAKLSNVKQGTNAMLSLKANFSKHETISLDGKFNPFKPKQFFHLNGDIKSFNMQQLSPYSYGSIGRNISSGRLSDLFYVNIDKSQLDSNHKVIINNLDVSDHIDESGAATLPINLAIALLQDMNQVINLNIDIQNDLDDPSFKAHNIILTVLTNVIVKTVSSPFSLLGAIAGLSGDDLSGVTFEAGSEKLTQENIVKLDALKKVFDERPELSLKLCSAYDEDDDIKVLKEKALEALMKTNTVEQIAKEYTVEINKDQEVTKAAILNKIQIDSKTLEDLASKRANGILKHLLSLNVDKEKLTICPDIKTQSLDVKFELNAK